MRTQTLLMDRRKEDSGNVKGLQLPVTNSKAHYR